MSTNQSNYSYSSTSYSSSSYSSSSNSNPNGGQPQTHSFSEHITSDPSGSTIHRTTQEPGQAPVQETMNVGPDGKYLGGGGGGGGAGQQRLEQGRVEEIEDGGGEGDKDREYEERMEEEYAKREGGA